jgi:hypothetical protein
VAEPRDTASSSPPASDTRRRASIPELVLELKDLCVAYVKQETVVPLEALLRYLAFGIAGSVLMGTGVMLLAVGCLRVLQTETGTTFTGDWSWVPYVIVFAALVVLATLVWAARLGFRNQEGRP